MFLTAFARQAIPFWVGSSAWQKNHIFRSEILCDCPFKIQTDIETKLFEERCSKIDRNNYPISTRKNILFCIFFGGLEFVGHSLAYVAHFVFLGDVWIRTGNLS
jgi:hypothetical protein